MFLHTAIWFLVVPILRVIRFNPEPNVLVPKAVPSFFRMEPLVWIVFVSGRPYLAVNLDLESPLPVKNEVITQNNEVMDPFLQDHGDSTNPSLFNRLLAKSRE